MRRFIALGAVLSMLVVGLTATSGTVGASPAPKFKPGAIAWGACTDPNLKAAHAQCGFLSVPLDYNDPGGTKIQLAVSRVVHTSPDSQYQGPILLNPGGPGGSGLIYSILGQFVPKHAGDSYDWIGFDPRGVGSSKPSLSCIPNYAHGDRPPYNPTKPAILNAWLTRSKAYADACAAHQPALLEHMKTTDVAQDMDSIREALGSDQLSFYGFSYGTWLGQVYATMFPSHVHRMVLDSNVDPRYAFYKANLHQDVAFERNMNIWFAWLAKYDGTYHLGKSAPAVSKLFYKQETELTLHPAGGIVGPDEWVDAFLGAGYYQQTWLDLADLFDQWVHKHNTAALIAAYRSADGPGNDNGYAVYNAVQCTDAPWPLDWKTWERANTKTNRLAPFETWGNAWFNAPCLYWAAPPATPVDVDGGHVAALLIDETLDAATPYPGSLEVRRRFPDSSLLAEPGGTTHADSLFGNACVDNTIADYLADGSLPARQAGDGPDAKCKPLPVPVPGSAAAVSGVRMAMALRLVQYR